MKDEETQEYSILPSPPKARDAIIRNIKVTTENGNTFDGDLTSQFLMTSVIVGLDDGGIIKWTLSNNKKKDVSKEELREALRLAGAEATAVW